jgi:hypothetical protein
MRGVMLEIMTSTLTDEPCLVKLQAVHKGVHGN